MSTEITLSDDDLDMLLNALTSMLYDEHYSDAYPSKRYWGKNRREWCYRIYQKLGRALGGKNIRVTWEP